MIKGNLSSLEIEEIMSSPGIKVLNGEVRALIRSDLEAGLTYDDVNVYLKYKGMDIDSMRLASETMKQSDEGRRLVCGCLQKSGKIRLFPVAIEFYKQGLSVDDLIDYCNEYQSPDDLRQMYELALSEKAEHDKQLSNNEQLEKLRNENDNLQTTIDSLNKQLESANTAMETQQTNLNNLCVTLSKQSNDIEELKNANAQLAADKAELEAKNARLTESEKTLTGEIAELKGEITELKGEISELKAKAETARPEEAKVEKTHPPKLDSEASSFAEPAVSQEYYYDDTPAKLPAQQPKSTFSPYGADAFEEMQAAQEAERKAQRDASTVEPIKAHYGFYLKGSRGQDTLVPIEVQKPKGFFVGLIKSFVEKRGSRRDVMRLASKGKFSPEQLEQLSMAIDAGLNDEQLRLLCDPKLTVGQMQGMIRIAVCQNRVRNGGA